MIQLFTLRNIRLLMTMYAFCRHRDVLAPIYFACLQYLAFAVSSNTIVWFRWFCVCCSQYLAVDKSTRSWIPFRTTKINANTRLHQYAFSVSLWSGKRQPNQNLGIFEYLFYSIRNGIWLCRKGRKADSCLIGAVIKCAQLNWRSACSLIGITNIGWWQLIWF